MFITISLQTEYNRVLEELHDTFAQSYSTAVTEFFREHQAGETKTDSELSYVAD